MTLSHLQLDCYALRLKIRFLFYGMILCGLVPMFGFSQDDDKKATDELSIRMRSRVPTEIDPGKYRFKFQDQKWKPTETAIIVCDFWDYHHCFNAVLRMKDFGPRLNDVIKKARQDGVTVIHSPSDCMDAYRNHPARKRVQELPSQSPPTFATGWCSQIPGEEKSTYPIDQSDGGEDDDPAAHKKWAEFLKGIGRNPNLPWKKQNDMIPIDAAKDFISDKGDEVWNVLKYRKIKNVILVGVHTNMCVLGRPFGLRQMKRFGFNVVLMRDMTDCMYNPARWPFVNHFAGNDRVVAHIEKFVCPTISSEQIIGGKEFSFESDPRPNLAIVIGESEYKTNQTLPAFAEKFLSDFRVTYVEANPDDRNDFPDVKKIRDADLMLLSVRRRVLKPLQMKVFKEFEAARKPILGIRTASHAFSLRGKKPPNGYEDWKSFDSEVFGGNYTNHYGNKLKSKVTYTEVAAKHPISRSLATEDDGGANQTEVITLKTFGQNGSLYKTAPLAEGTNILLMGSVLGQPPEPAAWTYVRQNKGKSFYTSLGHPLDFQNHEFVSLLNSAVHWAADKKVSKPIQANRLFWRNIDSIRIPSDKSGLKFELEDKNKLDAFVAKVAFRKAITFPVSWKEEKDVRVRVTGPAQKVWLNGNPLRMQHDEAGPYWKFDPSLASFGEANWVTVGVSFRDKESVKASRCDCSIRVKNRTQKIGGDWEWISAGKDFAEESRMYLPAKFGASPRIFVDLK